jgi:hypothetical protein
MVKNQRYLLRDNEGLEFTNFLPQILTLSCLVWLLNCRLSKSVNPAPFRHNNGRLEALNQLSRTRPRTRTILIGIRILFAENDEFFLEPFP